MRKESSRSPGICILRTAGSLALPVVVLACLSSTPTVSFAMEEAELAYTQSVATHCMKKHFILPILDQAEIQREELSADTVDGTKMGEDWMTCFEYQGVTFDTSVLSNSDLTTEDLKRLDPEKQSPIKVLPKGLTIINLQMQKGIEPSKITAIPQLADFIDDEGKIEKGKLKKMRKQREKEEAKNKRNKHRGKKEIKPIKPKKKWYLKRD